MSAHLCTDILLEEIVDGVGGDGEELAVDSGADTLLTSAHAEGAGQLDLVAQIVLGDELLQLFNNLARTLDVARGADTNGDFLCEISFR